MEQNEVSIPVTTTLKESAYREIKEKGYKVNLLVYQGLQAMKGFPYLQARQEQLEQENKELIEKNNKLYRIITQMQGDLHATQESINGIVQKW